MKRSLSNLVLALVFILLGVLLANIGAFPMSTKKAFVIEEPLLIEGPSQAVYSVLPVGTTLYLDTSWPEGHETFHVYFHFKGDLKATPSKSNEVAPLWLRTLDQNEIAKLISEYPLSQDELVALLKAKRITKQELTQILREWKE